ncbi:MAG: cell division protein ZapA [Chitinivibrionales bacterium]|nr:cell division protein ZapA [Chitinivibrionales bacterium]MBD3357929.1 cell division protein ZapA [Chitinivibrionales bacterium]
MDGEAESVRVYIGGDEYSIKGDVDAETTKRIADYVDRKMAELQRSLTSRDKVKVAVLSALNIAGELFEYRSRFDEANQQLCEIQEIASKISRHIDNTL